MPRLRFPADDSGATLVEFALVAPIFLGLLLSTFEVAAVEMVSVSFSNAMESVSREVRTGQRTKLTSAADFKKRICENMAAGADCAQRMRVDVQSFGGGTGGTFGGLGTASSAPPPPLPVPPPQPVAGAPAPKPPPPEAYSPGGAREIVLVTATYRWQVITPFLGAAFPRDGANIYMRRRLVFRNEPF